MLARAFMYGGEFAERKLIRMRCLVTLPESEIGGTFTDVVLFDEDTNSVAKAVVSLGDASL